MNKILKLLSVTIFYLFLISGSSISDENKIKIGLLVPLSGDNAELGKQIIKATRMALKEINTDTIEIYPKDTGSNPKKTLKSFLKFRLSFGLMIINE